MSVSIRREYVNDISLNCSRNEKKFQMKVVGKIKIHISCQIRFSELRAVYELITKNTAGQARP